MAARSVVNLVAGQVHWARPDSTVGRKQSGRRPVIVVSGTGYHDTITTLALVVPVTSVERGWDNHVQVSGPSGLPRASFAMTEQVRVVSRDRLDGLLGAVDDHTLDQIRGWIRDYLTD